MTTTVLTMSPDAVTKTELSSLLLLVSETEREEIFRLPEKKRAEKLCASLLLSRLLRREEIPLSALRRTERGKPVLLGRENCFVSLTHTSVCAAAALSDVPVGVDAETFRPLPEKLLCRFLTQEEFLSLPQEPSLRMRRAIALWTKKEAYSKRLGVGLALSFSSFCALSGENFVTVEKETYSLSVSTAAPRKIRFEECAPSDFLGKTRENQESPTPHGDFQGGRA